MIDVVEQVIERHPKVKNEGIPEGDHRRRLHEHLSGESICSAPKVHELAMAGLEPTMEIVAETSTVEEAHAIERRMLIEHRKARIPLCNNRYGRMPHHIHRSHGRGWDDKSKAMAADMFATGAGATHEGFRPYSWIMELGGQLIAISVSVFQAKDLLLT
jgi:hypothetical protein